MPQPDWNSIFKRLPELEAPGYQETLQRMRQRQPDYDAERLRAKMQLINKEKQGAKAKNRNKAAAKPLVAPDSVNPLFGVNKGRGKKR